MGGHSSKPSGPSKAAHEAKQAQRQVEAPLKLLLLGAENSGKTTLWKNILSQDGNGHLWLNETTAKALGRNIIKCMRSLANQASRADAAPALSADSAKSAAFFTELKDEETDLNEDVVKHAAILWKDAGIQSSYARRNTKGFILEGSDSLGYLIDHAPRFLEPAFSPSSEDTIRTFTSTRGTGEHVNHSDVMVHKHHLLLVDTDGQVNQSMKWSQVHRYEGVSALVFVVSLTSFAEVVLEDESKNAMEHSLSLFEKTASLKDFADTPLVLVFNKKDLFEQRLADGANISVVFKDYKGKPGDVAGSLEHIHKTFEDAFHRSRHAVNRQGDVLYIEDTCSVDAQSVESSIERITDVVVKHRNAAGIAHKIPSHNPLNRMFSNQDLGHDDA